jgi:hypothetical protein
LFLCWEWFGLEAVTARKAKFTAAHTPHTSAHTAAHATHTTHAHTTHAHTTHAAHAHTALHSSHATHTTTHAATHSKVPAKATTSIDYLAQEGSSVNVGCISKTTLSCRLTECAPGPATISATHSTHTAVVLATNSTTILSTNTTTIVAAYSTTIVAAYSTAVVSTHSPTTVVAATIVSAPIVSTTTAAAATQDPIHSIGSKNGRGCVNPATVKSIKPATPGIATVVVAVVGTVIISGVITRIVTRISPTVRASVVTIISGKPVEPSISGKGIYRRTHGPNQWSIWHNWAKKARTGKVPIIGATNYTCVSSGVIPGIVTSVILSLGNPGTKQGPKSDDSKHACKKSGSGQHDNTSNSCLACV